MTDNLEFIKSMEKLDGVIINLVGLRHDIELLPCPTVQFILYRALAELKESESHYNKFMGVDSCFRY